MRIAVVVHGRFHAFHLASALLRQGEDVTLFTNYPKFVAARYGIPPERVESFLFHGAATRAAFFVWPRLGVLLEPFFHRLFSRWAVRRLRRSRWDVISVFSGVAEEVFECPDLKNAVRILTRGSAHIRVQDRILAEEGDRAHFSPDRPSPWMIERELREYALADYVTVLSFFAWQSFVEEGYPSKKLILLPLGADLGRFRPSREALDRRIARILSGAPLTAVTVGNVSYQKGLLDLLEIARRAKGLLRFRWIGGISEDVLSRLGSEERHLVEFLQHRPESELPSFYEEADLFLFPTLQDGYAVVLAQAMASGLPILTTTNCAGPDIVVADRSGWVLPIRDPGAFIERLLWCDKNRAELAAMVEKVYSDFKPRDWSDIAEDFCGNCRHIIAHRGRFSP